jgi:hypothetical protein
MYVRPGAVCNQLSRKIPTAIGEKNAKARTGPLPRKLGPGPMGGNTGRTLTIGVAAQPRFVSFPASWRYSGIVQQTRYAKAAGAITVLFMAGACTISPSASAVATASPTASPVASASPSPAASTTPTAQLLCTLPVDRTLNEAGARDLGALLDIPSTDPNTQDDPSSDVNLPDGEPRVGLSYDWALKRWLPVPRTWVAADGARYAYADAQSRIHLVTVITGVDQILASGAPWGIYSYGAGGIYAGQQDLTQPASPRLRGLWTISLTGGAPEQVTSQGTWPVIGIDAAWSVAPSATSQVSADGYGTVLSRLDLLSRQVTSWYSSTSGDFRVATLDTNGRPLLVSRNGQGTTISVVMSSGTAQTIAIPFSPSRNISDVMADPYGVWYADTFTINIYLVQAQGSQSMGQYGHGGTIKFAGPCQ